MGRTRGMLGLAQLHHSASAFVVIVIVIITQAVELNFAAAAACMDELAVAGINCHVVNASAPS